MSINQKITKTLNVQAAETFVESLQKDAPYYVFAAKHTQFSESSGGGSDEAPPVPLDNVLTATQVYNDMIFGKRVKDDGVSSMIKRYEWSENTVYDMYTDNDPDLSSKQFYVVVDDTVELNVYKCLYNNNNAPSTQRPSDKDINPVESLLDGYIWKYMYTIDQFNLRKFATTEYVPVTPNETITAAAVDGSIEVITVQEGGSGYNNYTAGIFPDSAAIAIDSNNRRFGLDSNASSINNFYNDCIIKIVTGGAANEYRLITGYEIIAGQKVITIDRAFNTRPSAEDEYEIFPNVFIYNVVGNIISNCTARAIINANTGNSVSRVEVLDAGEGYRVASATIKIDTSVSVTGNAVITPVMSPPGGHGSNINNELFGNFVGITASFTGNNTPLTTDNEYRTIGLLRAPQYSSVEVKLDASNRRGTFVAGEEIYRYKPIKLFGNVSVTVDEVTATGSNTEFIDTLRTNDRIIITDGVTNTLANVQSIVSNTDIILDTPSRFTSGNCALYLVDALRFGTAVSSNSISITLTNVDPVGIENSSYLLGDQSFCTAAVDRNATPNIFISGRNADEFNGFNQLSYFVGSGDASIAFIEDELLYQGTDSLTRATARMHSYRADPEINKDRLYVTNITNVFEVPGGAIVGLDSQETFAPTYKYNGELVPNSGEILYLENLFPITRDVKQTETVKLIIEF
jgi:hypothetical protein